MGTKKQGAREAAILANCLIALTKFIAAFWTGSSSMLSEGVHSLVNAGIAIIGPETVIRCEAGHLPIRGRGRLKELASNWSERDVRFVTDGERILGLGDLA